MDNEPSELTRSPSNFRLRKSIDFLLFTQNKLRETSSSGIENIESLDNDETVVIATSHTTGFDVPLTIQTLGSHMDIAIADQSTHGRFAKEPAGYIGQKVAGPRNFIPISYSWHDGRKHADRFNPQDSLAMDHALRIGKNVLIAAHKPLKSRSDGSVMAPRAGYLAAYVATQSKKRILPVGVSYTPSLVSPKYDASVAIGEPFELEAGADVDLINDLSMRQRYGRLTLVENEMLTSELHNLRADGAKVLQIVQSLQNLDQPYPVLDKA